MQIRGGMNELLRQAARMQRKVEDVKAKLKDREVSGTAAGGKVSVTVSCEGKVRRIDVDPGLVAAEGMEIVLDSIVGATNAALEAADKLVEGEVAKVTGGLKIPGLGT